MTVTQWFSGDEKPVHIGLYERQYDSGNYIEYWDGLEWRYPVSQWPAFIQDVPWRGIAK